MRGIVWNYASYYSGRVLVFISTVILARLLSKEDFGVAGYAIIVISFLDVLNEFGIGPALIYHEDSKEASDTAFWLGLLVSFSLYGITWLVAPLAGAFFQDPRAVPVVRVLALTFPLTAFGSVQYALIQKGLAFDRKAIPDIGRALSRGVIAITLALLGFGAWSLIIGQIGGVIIWGIILWIIVPWRPSFRFVPGLARSILSYGTGSLLVDGLSILQLNADYLFVGRFLGAVALGVYTIAFRIPEMIIIQFCTIIARVIFPAYTKVRDDPDMFRKGFIATTRYVSLVTVPLGFGIMLVTEPFVLAFFTDKWVEAIPVMRLLALSSMIFSLSFHSGDVYKAQGRLSILNKIILVQILLTIPGLYWAVTVVGTIEAAAWVHVVVAAINSVIEMYVACRIIGIPFYEIPRALRPSVVSGALMSAVVIGTLLLLAQAPSLVQLFAGMVVGLLAYAGSLWLIEKETVAEIRQTLPALLKKKSA